SMSIDEAIAKIRTAVGIIDLRGGVRDHEGKRVEEAFTMLAQPPELSSGKTGEKTSKRRESYLRFLRQVNKQCGSQLVVAISVGIGQSAIASMKELTRLRLPLEIKKYERALKSPTLQKVAEEFCSKGRDTLSFTNITVDVSSVQSHRPISNEPDAPISPVQPYSEQPKLPSIPLDMFGSQTSRVFELTLEDVQGIITSQQVLGRYVVPIPLDSYRRASLLHIVTSSSSVEDFAALTLRSVI
ncbi:hypothetical protein EJ07DRAFT_24361, partial [Lizonia empirigonia]